MQNRPGIVTLGLVTIPSILLITIATIKTYKELPEYDNMLSYDVAEQVEITLKYAGYIQRQELEVAKIKSLEEKNIPPAFDYSTVPSLRAEARQKLHKIRPLTLGQAARISGVSPADISILMVWLKRGEAK